MDNELEIVKTLSPSMQIRLVNLNKNGSVPFSFEKMQFFSSKVVFELGKNENQFLRKIELDHRDQEFSKTKF